MRMRNTICVTQVLTVFGKVPCNREFCSRKNLHFFCSTIEPFSFRHFIDLKRKKQFSYFSCVVKRRPIISGFATAQCAMRESQAQSWPADLARITSAVECTMHLHVCINISTISKFLLLIIAFIYIVAPKGAEFFLLLYFVNLILLFYWSIKIRAGLQ